MQLKIGYGTTGLTLDIREENISEFIQPALTAPNEAQDDFLLEPDDLDSLRQTISGKKIGLMIADATRDFAYEQADAVFEILSHATEIKVFVCAGTHDPALKGNGGLIHRITSCISNAGISRYSIHVHDFANDLLIDAGRTESGTPVLYNAGMDGLEAFVVFSDVKPHYFAGYSNPVKYFVPGVCGHATAQANHSLTMDARSIFGVHPWHADAARLNNPLAADQIEAMEMILKGRPVWALTTVTGQPSPSLGPIRRTCEEAFTQADQTLCRQVDPARYVIVSPGGMPNDIDLYISQRALELSKQAMLDGAEVLFVSACPQGVGPEHSRRTFYDKLIRPLEEVLQGADGEYELYAHKPYRFGELISRLNKLWMHSEIAGEQIRAMHMEPAPDPQAVIDRWISSDPQAKILIIDGANKIGIHAR